LRTAAVLSIAVVLIGSSWHPHPKRINRPKLGVWVAYALMMDSQ
jgi:hypothetical protein